MSLLAWSCAAFGLALAASLAGVVVWDVSLKLRGKRTVSEWCLDQARERPWVPVALSAPVFLVLGVLIGHLWFPQ